MKNIEQLKPYQTQNKDSNLFHQQKSGNALDKKAAAPEKRKADNKAGPAINGTRRQLDQDDE